MTFWMLSCWEGITPPTPSASRIEELSRSINCVGHQFWWHTNRNHHLHAKDLGRPQKRAWLIAQQYRNAFAFQGIIIIPWISSLLLIQNPQKMSKNAIFHICRHFFPLTKTAQVFRQELQSTYGVQVMEKQHVHLQALKPFSNRLFCCLEARRQDDEISPMLLGR